MGEESDENREHDIELADGQVENDFDGERHDLNGELLVDKHVPEKNSQIEKLEHPMKSRGKDPLTDVEEANDLHFAGRVHQDIAGDVIEDGEKE